MSSARRQCSGSQPAIGRWERCHFLRSGVRGPICDRACTSVDLSCSARERREQLIRPWRLVGAREFNSLICHRGPREKSERDYDSHRVSRSRRRARAEQPSPRVHAAVKSYRKGVLDHDHTGVRSLSLIRSLACIQTLRSHAFRVSRICI